jgi:hypothetical protein
MKRISSSSSFADMYLLWDKKIVANAKAHVREQAKIGATFREM